MEKEEIIKAVFNKIGKYRDRKPAIKKAISLTMQIIDQKVVDIVGDCKVYRDVFILKKELIRKLEEAFPEK